MLIHHFHHSLISISRECQDRQEKKERVGMLAQWLVLLSISHTHHESTAMVQVQTFGTSFLTSCTFIIILKLSHSMLI